MKMRGHLKQHENVLVIHKKKTDYNSITSLKQDGKLITDTKQKASVLNQQFQSVFSEPSTKTTQKCTEQNYMKKKNTLSRLILT
jgi:hypothetical protein